jgi:hypothetical protein
MEENQNSRATSLIPVTPKFVDRVPAPKDFFLGPVFAATRQTGQREVIIGDRHYLLGGFHPLREDRLPAALDVRHARAIFTLLSFRTEYQDNPRIIRFAFGAFCRRYANSNGGRYLRAIKEIISDLTDSYIQVTELKTKVATSYRLIERVVIQGRPIARRDSAEASSNQTELRLNEISLSPEFYRLLNRIAELQDLKLSVFTSIRSPLAQAIYLYIPSRSVHHDERDPFEISLTKLLEQVSFPVPEYKSKRKELFTKHAEQGRSILQQLDGRETLTGRFKVRLVETADGSDWKLQTWVEKSPQPNRFLNGESKIIKAYLASGRPQEYLEQALANIRPLSDYEIDLMNAASIEVEKSRKCFEMLKAILKEPSFHSALAEAKSAELEGRKARKNPTARLIHRLQEIVATPPQLARK